ncbi:synaptonemal complex central element protein 1-like isoform X5 [Eretmochelys imbricata]
MNPAVRACECFCCAQNSLPHGSPSPCVVSRLEFEQQLDELMEKHKTLQECHLIQDNLAQVEKQLDSLPQAEAAPSQERMFLKSQEASSALQLFQQENKRATEYLEAASCRHSELQQKFKRLTAELEAQQQESGGAPASMETA